ncbi:aspartyl protease family protein [Hymenobacter weizhouensis]|uniref:aspartyl protease family protein n=1 Tax=Hymenobacter sp. YIM 151500-1 TaxID=2987689 RepID=UPI0022278332|nr:aspartyl protease family protein [Hymenobacter sp. YIM 151500-1]UYZ63605.1 aspartyl protease family protein [Hymenobacter sp. YIM 151500-1]
MGRRLGIVLLFSGRVRVAGAVLLALWLGLLAAGPARAQTPPPAFRFERAGARQARVPFQIQRNLMVVEATINGQGPFNFMLDTGIGISLITDPALVRQLNLQGGAQFLVAGAGEEKPLVAQQITGVHVRLGKTEAPSMSFLALSDDVLNLSGYVGMPIHGLLGSDVFRSFVVQVQPEQEYVVLHDPARYRVPRGRRWTRLSLDLEGNKSYLTLPVQVNDTLTLPLKLVLDTGAGHALSLETTSDPRLRLPDLRLRTQLGRGLSGDINGYLGRVAALQLGRYRVALPLTSFPDAAAVAHRADVPRNGNLGFELLKRFEMVIDYSRNQLLLRPNRLYKDPFEHDMCGFDVLASGPHYRQYRVLRVQAGSPAEQAGLLPGDEILSINFLPAESLSLTQLSRLLHSQNGRQIFFIVRRATTGDLHTAVVRLKRQI